MSSVQKKKSSNGFVDLNSRRLRLNLFFLPLFYWGDGGRRRKEEGGGDKKKKRAFLQGSG